MSHSGTGNLKITDTAILSLQTINERRILASGWKAYSFDSIVKIKS